MFIGAKFLFAGQVSGVFVGEHLGRLVVLSGEALDAGTPSLQVLVEVSRVPTGTDKFRGRALELVGGTLDEADLLRIGWHVAVGCGPAQPPGSRVEFGGLTVERGPGFL